VDRFGMRWRRNWREPRESTLGRDFFEGWLSWHSSLSKRRESSTLPLNQNHLENGQNICFLKGYTTVRLTQDTVEAGWLGLPVIDSILHVGLRGHRLVSTDVNNAIAAPMNNDQVPSLTSEEIDSINAIFVDAENDEELSFQPLAPSLDLDALRREADARNAKNVVPMAPVTLTNTSSSKPPNVFGSALEMDDKEEEGGKKQRRTIPKLDEGRLLGPNGFPQLIKDTKNFKPKGKGHEVRLILFFALRSGF
jgi:hypothetical protein